MEIEWARLVDPCRKVLENVTSLGLADGEVFHAAVNLVGRGKKHDRVLPGVPRRFEDVERAERIDLEVGTRIGYGRRYGSLAGEVIDHFGVADREIANLGVANVADDQIEIIAVNRFQPGDVFVSAAAGEVIENGDVVAAFDEPVRQIDPDEAGPARDENRPRGNGVCDGRTV